MVIRMIKQLAKQLWIFFLLLTFAIALGLVLGFAFTIPRGNVAIIPVIGEISFARDIFAGGVTSDEIIDFLKQAEENPNIKAVVIEINSPGGSVVSIQEVAEKLRKLKKPTICLIREVGMSGAYWVASACRRVIANPLSLTGNIGVSASYLEFSGLLRKLNVSYVRLVSGEHKDIGSPFREPTPEELARLKSILQEIHQAFVETVAENRGLPLEYVRNLSDGSIFLGREAKEKKLVDELGGLDRALEIAKELANITEVQPVRMERKVGLLEILAQFFSRFQLDRLLVKLT
jgi:protease-4